MNRFLLWWKREYPVGTWQDGVKTFMPLLVIGVALAFFLRWVCGGTCK